MFTKKRFIGVLTCAVLLAAMISAPANAAITLNITAGTLNFDGGAPAIGNFSGVTLNGTPQLTSLAVDPFTVVDATGSGDGWNVALTVPDLSTGGLTPDTIASSNISMTIPVVTASGTSDITGVVGHASAGGFDTGEKIVTASAGNGEGTYLVAPRILKLTIPVTTMAGAYTSAATIATVDGP